MNKNIFAGLAVSAVLAMAASSPVMANNAAWVKTDGTCGMFDQYMGSILSEGYHRVITSSEKSSLKCYATTANDSGKAIRFTGFDCYVNGVLTNKSMQTIDSLGNAVMTCQVK